ncbi:beta-defensin 108B [Vicugna pacos]|uniref:Beta-defensin 108B n=1 Tax=Vicugna pacos TaxID=30538 RepID=A0A6J3BJC4_VICPA
MDIALMRYRRALDIRTRHSAVLQDRRRKLSLPLEMKPSLLRSPAMRVAVPLFTILIFMSQVPPGSSGFREVCARPNGSCHEFCIESEIQVGRCLDGRACCLPMGNVPQIDPTTPKGR